MIAALPVFTGYTSAAADISGEWKFSVDLEDGGHGDPTFVFKQEGEKLTGTYNGPLGEYKVTGTVTGSKAVFGFEFTGDGQTVKATYTGNIESSTKMTGTVEFTPAGARQMDRVKKRMTGACDGSLFRLGGHFNGVDHRVVFDGLEVQQDVALFIGRDAREAFRERAPTCPLL